MFEIMEKENYYAHRRRLFWIKSRIGPNEKCIDVGCGTGSMLTIPLNLLGCNVWGIDIDESSIAAARSLAQEAGISSDIFLCDDIKNIETKYDVVIASEVLEHIEDCEIKYFMENLCKMTARGGKLIITVPNGKGSFERGKRNWEKYWGKWYDRWIATVIWIKKVFMRKRKEDAGTVQTVMEEALDKQMSLHQTPHVQFFSYSDIIDLVGSEFELNDFTGSAMFSGMIINTIFPKKQFICKINNFLGMCFPKKSSGYYFEFIKKK